jgi:hypothetical protein
VIPLTLDTKIHRVKELVAQREKIDAELAGLFGETSKRKWTRREPQEPQPQQ